MLQMPGHRHKVNLGQDALNECAKSVSLTKDIASLYQNNTSAQREKRQKTYHKTGVTHAADYEEKPLVCRPEPS